MSKVVSVSLATQKSELAAIIQRALEKRKREYITWLQYVGEMCVNDARLSGSYTDRTGNLRSSTGYAIIDNGQIVKSADFKQVAQGSAGPTNGKQFLQRIATESNSALVLVIVAGMNYAAYVQDKGYNVLDSAEALAEKLISKLLKK